MNDLKTRWLKLTLLTILVLLLLGVGGWWYFIKRPENQRISELAHKIEQSSEYTIRLKYVGWFRQPTTFKVKVAWGKWNPNEEKVFEYESQRAYSPNEKDGSFKIHWKQGDKIVFQVFINGWKLLAHSQNTDKLSLKIFHGVTALPLEKNYTTRANEFENGQGPEVEFEVIGFSDEDWKRLESL